MRNICGNYKNFAPRRAGRNDVKLRTIDCGEIFHFLVENNV